MKILNIIANIVRIVLGTLLIIIILTIGRIIIGYKQDIKQNWPELYPDTSLIINSEIHKNTHNE